MLVHSPSSEGRRVEVTRSQPHSSQLTAVSDWQSNYGLRPSQSLKFSREKYVKNRRELLQMNPKYYIKQ